jgi:hypothetical protein
MTTDDVAGVGAAGQPAGRPLPGGVEPGNVVDCSAGAADLHGQVRSPTGSSLANCLRRKSMAKLAVQSSWYEVPTKVMTKFVAKLMAKLAPGFGVPTKPVPEFPAKFRDQGRHGPVDG